MKPKKIRVSIVIPTYNESNNIPILIEEIFLVLKSVPQVDAEIIIVDDNSPDGTGAIVEGLGKTYPLRVIHRAGKLGLGSAVMEGFKLSDREYLGVMDGDLSHDPSVLPEIFAKLGAYDIVIGSRFNPESKMEGKWPFFRKLSSVTGVFLAKLISRVNDPLSGYFFTKRTVVENVQLTSPGYKILFEILVKGNYSSTADVPFIFRSRKYSSSKLDFHEYVLFIKQIIFLGIRKICH